MRLVLRLVLALVLLCASRPGFAQTSEGDARRAAYRQGYAAIQAKQWEEAYGIFRRLWRESPTYDVALHLGHAEFNLGKNREAAEHLAFGIAHLPPGEAKELADESRRALARVKQEIGTVTLIVDRSGAKVSVDGEARGITPIDFEIFVDPGVHDIDATLDGYQPTSAHFQITRAEHQNIVLKLDPVMPAATPGALPPPPPAAASAETQGGSNGRTIAILSGVGVTVIAAASSIGFAIKSGSASRRADDARATADRYGPNACASPITAPANVCVAIQRAEDDRVAASRGANISLAVTGVAALATATMLIVWPRSTKGTSPGGIAVTPMAARNTGALFVTGTFD